MTAPGIRPRSARSRLKLGAQGAGRGLQGGWPLLPLATALVFAASCASGQGREGVSTASEAASTSTQARSATPTAAELRWAERQQAWIVGVQGLVAVVEAAKERGRGRLDAEALEIARRAIFDLYKCADRRQSKAPTARTALINDTLAKGCARLQRAALDASGHLLVKRAFNDARGAGEDWEEDVGIALDLLRSAEAEIEALASAV